MSQHADGPACHKATVQENKSTAPFAPTIQLLEVIPEGGLVVASCQCDLIHLCAFMTNHTEWVSSHVLLCKKVRLKLLHKVTQYEQQLVLQSPLG